MLQLNTSYAYMHINDQEHTPVAEWVIHSIERGNGLLTNLHNAMNRIE